MNRYQENALQAVRYLNAKPASDKNARYECSLFIDGVKVEDDYISFDSWRGNPLYDKEIVVHQYLDEEQEETKKHVFTRSDIIKVDIASGSFSYQKGNVLCVIQQEKKDKFGIDNFMMELVNPYVF
jgi:hypothetical protein